MYVENSTENGVFLGELANNALSAALQTIE